MDNLSFWNKFRAVPETAKKTITGGRLNGMTDINPMHRMKSLTEEFGPVGDGWKYEILSKELKQAGDEIAAFVDINLYYKRDGEWSEPIPGTGGSMFFVKEKHGLRTNDECFKMALTDAISVACKALGIGADVYWQKDANKYQPSDVSQEYLQPIKMTKAQLNSLFAVCTTPDGQKDVQKASLLKQIYTRMGYKKAEQIPGNMVDDVIRQLKGGVVNDRPA